MDSSTGIEENGEQDESLPDETPLDPSAPDVPNVPEEGGDESGQPDEEYNPVPGPDQTTGSENDNADAGDEPGVDEDTDGDETDRDDGPVQTIGSWDKKATTAFRAVSRDSRDQHDVPVTVGQVFARGDIPDGRTVVALNDGQRIPAQVDKKATWSDGSLRHAVVTVRLDAVEADTASRVSLHAADGAETGLAITIDQLLATSFDAVVSVRRGGATYTISARDLLYQASASGCSRWGKACKKWLSGPLAAEWIVGGAPTANGTKIPNLNVYFNVRAYAGPDGMIDRARVDFVMENARAYDTALQNASYDASLTTGAAHYEVEDLTHYTRARWHRVLWWQKTTQVYARVDTRYLQKSRAISRYADLMPTEGFLNGLASEYPPMKNGDQTKAMGATGAQEGIGPLPRWTSTYVVSSDPRAFHWMLANDDAVGSYGFHFRDERTGRPVDIINRPYVTIADLSWARQSRNPKYKKDLLPRCAGVCDTPYTFNIPHHPSIGYVPYLVTGDYYYLEEMQFAGSYVELWANENYRQHEYGRLRRAQGSVRGQAWGMRSLSDAAFATPDDDPLKSYFETMMKNNMADYEKGYLEADPTRNPLQIINQYAAIYKVNDVAATGIAPWQNDFFTWAIGHAAEQGFVGARELSRYFSAFPIERMTGWQKHAGGFCWTQAAVYAMQIRPSSDAPDYASLDEVYAAMYPDLANLQCDSQEMANLWAGGRYEVGEMSGYAHSPTGFPSNFQIGLAMAANTDLPNAAAAWDIFASRSVRPDYRNYPNFAVVPRN